MGYYNEQTIRDADAHTSDDDWYDRIDYGRTNSLESARQNARAGSELGDLRRRWNGAARAGYVKSAGELALDLIDTIRAARLTGNVQNEREARAQLEALIERGW
jgi:hypothetical protein